MNRSTIRSLSLGVAGLLLCIAPLATSVHASDTDVSDVARPEVMVAVQSRDALVQRDLQIVFSDDQALGGSLYDLTEFAGRSNISSEELAAGHPLVSWNNTEGLEY